MKTYLLADPLRYAEMMTEELRQNFLIEGLFAPGRVVLNYIDLDRTVVGSAVPVASPIPLGTDDSLRAEYFTERRELGVLNVGGRGSIIAAGKSYEMDHLDCLYIGRGTRDVSFASTEPGKPAHYYLISYPAHASHPTMQAKKAQAAAVNLGTPATCNQRTIFKYIHAEGIKSCQLVMGFTQLAVGSAWNTMPPHTHMRRSEVYLYFNMAADARVFHFMGPPLETRHLVVADRQAVVSPSWSIHSGVGTGQYSFCWAMGGENQTFDDMDGLPIAILK
ncbi:MAG TPA: 5-dehydro-4-deoxy-D-glucuronate isomerase [Tepidisphaeraceae bacterium]|nr:5-dehydro-4-deoxy-D-glucuronate isomerase [Tepidisphaeraceae bacterium]